MKITFNLLVSIVKIANYELKLKGTRVSLDIPKEWILLPAYVHVLRSLHDLQCYFVLHFIFIYLFLVVRFYKFSFHEIKSNLSFIKIFPYHTL